MSKEINIKTFLEKSKDIPVLDVRTPDEYRQGHITGAINFPLFNTNERAVIGRIYKEHGLNAATLKGLEICAGRTGKFIKSGQEFAKDKSLLLHCWRGGIRSASLAWLFETAGIKSFVLRGGYKAYRRYALKYLKGPFKLIVLGGMTGSGKTEMLNYIKILGFQVLELETLAHHKGSAFGALGEIAQNSNEQFENDIFGFLYKCKPEEPIWVEDESHNIGKNLIPYSLFSQIIDSPLICIETKTENRINRLVENYSEFPRESLSLSINKISKRLGGLKAKSALEYLEHGDFRKVAGLMLSYYDKTYSYSLRVRNPEKIFPVKINSPDLKKASDKIIRTAVSMGLIRH
jgi:tRNA 2-selenouridine synthase